MPTTTKQELVDRIARRLHVKSATVMTIVQQFLEQITLELAKNNRLEFRDFGVFEPQARKARTAMNPKTQESISVPAKRFVRFKMGRRMKDKMNANIRE